MRQVLTHGKQRNDHIELGIRAGEVVLLRHEAGLGEPAAHQQALQLVFRLPGDPHGRHVESLVVAEVHLRPLSALPRILPALKPNKQEGMSAVVQQKLDQNLHFDAHLDITVFPY